MKRRIAIILSFFISIFFVWMAIRKVDFISLKNALLSANFLYFIPAVILTFIAFFVRAIRWRYLILPHKKLPFNMIYHSTMIGFMCNYTLPARLGEFIRAYLLGSRVKIGKSAAFATIIVERVFDVFALSIILLIIIIFNPVPQWLKTAGLIVSMFSIFVFLLLMVMHYKTDVFLFIIHKIFGVFGEKVKSKTGQLFSTFSRGLEILKSTKYIFIGILWSFFIWGITGLLLYILFYSLDIKLPFYAAYLDMVIFTFGIMIPSTAGFIGTFHYFVQQGLVIFGIESSTALTYSILLHASQFLVVVSAGIISLWILGISFRKVRKKASSYKKEKKKEIE